MNGVRAVHSSGRFDRPLVELGRALDAYAGAGYLADVVTLTEQDGADRQRESLYTAHGWAWFRALRRGAGECAVLWSHERLYVTGEPRAVELTSRTYWRKGGAKAAPPHAAIVPLRPKGAGRVLIVSVAHLPVRNTALRRLVWRYAVRGWVRHLRAELDRYPYARLLVRADWNVDLRTDAGRKLVTDALAGLPGRLVVPEAAAGPAGGTHGRRIIDADWTDLPAARSRVIADDASSDHRPYLTSTPPAR